jgi:predicted transcriptional regulator
MSRRAVKKYPEEEMIAPSEDVSRLSMSTEERRRKLDQILEHAGTIEFDLDPETLEPLRPLS